MNLVDHWGRRSGIVKVIPPDEWCVLAILATSARAGAQLDRVVSSSTRLPLPTPPYLHPNSTYRFSLQIAGFERCPRSRLTQLPTSRSSRRSSSTCRAALDSSASTSAASQLNWITSKITRDETDHSLFLSVSSVRNR